MVSIFQKFLNLLHVQIYLEKPLSHPAICHNHREKPRIVQQRRNVIGEFPKQLRAVILIFFEQLTFHGFGGAVLCRRLVKQTTDTTNTKEDYDAYEPGFRARSGWQDRDPMKYRFGTQINARDNLSS